jgi:hypothetical protein
VHKISRTIQVYVYLNLISNGKIKLPESEKKNIADSLKITIKTFKTHLEKLIELNWIGYNPISGFYFIRGLNYVHRHIGVKTKTSSEFLIEEILFFKEFCIASFVGYLIQLQKSKRWRSGRLKARPNHEDQVSNLKYNFVCLSTLARFLDISKSSAHRYVRKAEKANYLSVEFQFTKLHLKKKDAMGLIKVFPQIRNYGKRVMLQEPNKTSHNMSFKRRKKMEP